MVLTEDKIVSTIEVNHESNTIQVKWLNRVMKDGVVISALPHRCAYSLDQKAQFLAEVEDSVLYAPILTELKKRKDAKVLK